MPLFDLFGLGQSALKDGGGKEDSAKTEKKSPTPASKRAWGALLGANMFFVVACAGYITVSVLQQRSAAAPKGKAAFARPKKGVKKKPAKTAKAEEKKTPETTKAEEKAPASQQTAKKTKGPIGSPSVHAPDLPERSAKPKPIKTAKKKQPAAGPASSGTAKKPPTKKKPKRVTKPITFEHGDPDAKKVSLVGMFLVSTSGSKPMYKGGEGLWQITLYLKKQITYRYQFEVIDQEGRKTLTPVKTISVK